MTPGDRAYELINGFRAGQIVHAAVELRIPDLVAAGPKPLDELSGATGIDRSRLRRLLRALAALGVLTESIDGGYANTEVGELYREGVPGSRRALVRMLIPESYRNWDHFMETLRTGVTGHQLAHGTTLWGLIARDPEFGARFNEAMAWNSQGVGEFVAASGNFTGASVVVDVGGGKGSLVAEVLLAYPSMRGIVFDLPAGLAQAAEYLASHGVADRCEIVEGDFFEAVPEGDVHLLKDILHDWDDTHATNILRTCRRALKPGSRVMVVERVMPSHVTTSPAHLNATMTDLQMMSQLGGQERTPAEYEAIFEDSGFRVDRLTPSDLVYHLVEAVAV